MTTFRYWVNGRGSLARRLAKLSYGVYIVHVPVMGALAMALLGAGSPGLLKYPVIAGATLVGSNVITFGYRRGVGRIG